MSKKGLVLLATGFEDTEGIASIDIFKRAELSLDIVSVMENNEIITQCDNHLLLKKNIIDCDLQEYDFVFIPGGRAVINVLSKMKKIDEIILDFVSRNKLVATICAAPMLVGRLGLFDNKKFTCFPGCEKGVKGIYKNNGVVVSDNFITGKAMGFSIDFALKVVEYLLGTEIVKKVEDSIYGK